MENKPPQELLDISDEAQFLFLDLCKQISLGKGRTMEVAVYVLAELVAAGDKNALAAVALWKKNRTVMQVASDALELARLNG